MLLLGMCPSLGLHTQRTPVERAGKSPVPGCIWFLSIPARHASFAACNMALMSPLTPVVWRAAWGLMASCSTRKM